MDEGCFGLAVTVYITAGCSHGVRVDLWFNLQQCTHDGAVVLLKIDASYEGGGDDSS